MRYLALLVLPLFGLAAAGGPETQEPPRLPKIVNAAPQAPALNLAALHQLLTTALADDPIVLPKPPVNPAKVHGRGHVTPKNIKELHAKSWAKHAARLKSLPHITAPAWDCRNLGIVGPVQDQGSCGSCWDVSACGVLDSAFISAGWFKPDGSLTISPQYIMDSCGPQNGGCNGDDASTVTTACRDQGIPTAQDYGPYTASSGRCHATSGMKLWRIDMQGYCDQNSGIASTQSIKDAVAKYGPISSAVDAGGFNGYTSGIMTGDGSNVDHDVSIIGWDDNKGGSGIGCWLVKNQWGSSWGDQGYCWIPYGKWSIGTSALWVHATPAVPPPPPPPLIVTPYKLYEGTMQAPVLVGTAAGYMTIPSAEADGHAIANKDNVAVMVHDATGAMVETIQPGIIPPPPPGPAPNTITINFAFPVPAINLGGFTLPAQNLTGTITLTPASQMSHH
jgi:hypothetical protein